MKKHLKNQNWVVRNKVYVEIISTIILTVATTYAIWDNHRQQNDFKKLTEIQYMPDFRIITGYSDTLNCENNRDTLFTIGLLNDGYKVTLNYTRLTPFIEIYHMDNVKTIPINQSQCYLIPKSKTGLLTSYSAPDIFQDFERVKDKMFAKIDPLLKDNELYGSKMKYILMISYKDYLSEETKIKYFEIDDQSGTEIPNEAGADYFELTRRGIPTSIGDLNEDSLGKLFMD